MYWATIFGQNVESEAHVFKPFHRGSQVVVLEVNEEMTSSRGGDGVIDDEFCRCEVRCIGADIVWVVNEVATNRQSCPLWLSFLWAVVTDDAAVCDGTICGYCRAWDEKDGVGASNASADALGEAAKFIGKRACPGGLCLGVIGQGAVFECLTSFGVQHGSCKVDCVCAIRVGGHVGREEVRGGCDSSDEVGKGRLLRAGRVFVTGK